MRNSNDCSLNTMNTMYQTGNYCSYIESVYSNSYVYQTGNYCSYIESVYSNSY